MQKQINTKTVKSQEESQKLYEENVSRILEKICEKKKATHKLKSKWWPELIRVIIPKSKAESDILLLNSAANWQSLWTQAWIILQDLLTKKSHIPEVIPTKQAISFYDASLPVFCIFTLSRFS